MHSCLCIDFVCSCVVFKTKQKINSSSLETILHLFLYLFLSPNRPLFFFLSLSRPTLPARLSTSPSSLSSSFSRSRTGRSVQNCVRGPTDPRRPTSPSHLSPSHRQAGLTRGSFPYLWPPHPPPWTRCALLPPPDPLALPSPHPSTTFNVCHAPPRLPSRNGRPTRAPPPLMAVTTDLAPTALHAPAPSLSTYKSHPEPRLSPHLLSGPPRSRASLLPLNPGAPPPVGAPPPSFCSPSQAPR
jgi:hypothetical protein